jgi:hypothetical protein
MELLCILLLVIAAVLWRQLRFVGKDEQLFVEDLTELRAVNGPATVFLPLLFKSSRQCKAVALGPLEYQLVTNSLDGSKRVEVGPKLLFLRPYDELDGPKQLAMSLKATEFVRLLDNQTGTVRVEVGEQGRVIPGPYETYVDSCGKRCAISLKCHEYVRIEDKMTGKTRVEQGEQLVFLTGHEELAGNFPLQVQQAVEIDEETAVLTRNKRDGQQQLVTTKQVFVPRSDEEIIEVRKLIKLADHEACIVRGKDGTDQFLFGKNAGQRAFFLPEEERARTHMEPRPQARKARSGAQEDRSSPHVYVVRVQLPHGGQRGAGPRGHLLLGGCGLAGYVQDDMRHHRRRL